MDKITKALQKLTVKEKKRIKMVIEALNSGDSNGLDIKKLRDRQDIFRIRVRENRIIYRNYNKKIKILSISRRDENTYR